ncbi:hypothetical protein [Muriicola sp. Z0-33]|uniref:hypothetical protein n=1 Tax=Muriicola sp. Z0-33 TaxID=2816957 RepID=UPI0022384BEE|nr:hypothetical protein [Muriicola sp. Z0-33]MCW5516912.1 hypothetical protein [Muriicola sp. Z0-33]
MLKSISNYLLLIISIAICGCTAADREPESTTGGQEQGTLNGNWHWVRSSGSIAGITVTPESSGKTMEIEFTQDMVFNKYVDNQLVYTSPYVIQLKDSIIQFTTLALFESLGPGFDHQVEQQFRLINNNSLLLLDPCCDNFTFEFER